MSKNMPIYSFSGEYRFLSNFWDCKVESPEDHMIYSSVEHAYQAAKSVDIRDRMKIMRCEKPGDAKRAGRTVKLRPDWEDVKKLIMFQLVMTKFTQTPELGALLIETGDRLLVEGNNWGDEYWGMIRRDECWTGHNYLGQILMAVRMVIE